MTITDKQAYGGDYATSLTGTVTANAGDVIVAVITARSAITLPTSWTLLYDSGVFAGNSLNQRLAFAYKISETSGTVSVTIGQSVNERIFLNLVSCGGVNTATFWTGSVVTATSAYLAAPNKTSEQSLIWGLSGSYITGNWTTSPSDLTFLGIASTPRNGTFIDAGSGTASGRTFSGANSAYSICAAVILTQQNNYKPSGTAIYQATINGEVTSSTITWGESKPANTSVAVGVSTDSTNYTAVSNGGTMLPAGTYNNQTIYIKVILATTDAIATPTVSGLNYSLQTAEDVKSIVLEMQPLERFESAAGDITVAYAGGALMGGSGPVAAFTQSFSPSDLAYKGDQNDAEHIKMSASAAGTLTRIYYTDTVPQDMGHIEIASVTATGALTKVSDL